MINDAKSLDLITQHTHLIEATGGNTGLGLALISAINGYKLTLVIPDNFSKEKTNVLKQFGSNVVYSDSSCGVGSHIRLVKNMLNENKEYYCLNQFENLSNPKAHYLGTAVEILSQLKGSIHIFMAGIGSGGLLVVLGVD